MLSVMTETPKIGLYPSQSTSGNVFSFGTNLKTDSYASRNDG